MEIGTIAELVAAVGSVGVLLIAVQTFRRQQQQDRARQASQIAAWVKGPTAARLRNASSLPAFMVTVEVGTPAGWEPPVMVPVGTKVLPPNDDLDLELPEGSWMLSSVRFTDSFGHHWVRFGDGTLRETKEPPPWVGCG